MKIKNVKPGDIIKIKISTNKPDLKFSNFQDDKWEVVKIYPHLVLAKSVKCPKIRRCFSYGDLVKLGLEMQIIDEDRRMGKWEKYKQ